MHALELLLASLVVSACGDSGSTPPIDARSCSQAYTGPLPQCAQSCGNDIAELCAMVFDTKNQTCSSITSRESCDGADTATCESLGYFGGTAGCTGCVLDTSACLSCKVGDAITACRQFEGSHPFLLVADAGADAVLVGKDAYVRTGGLVISGSPSMSGEPTSAVGVPGGWLLRYATDLVRMNTDGSTGTFVTLPGNDHRMVYGGSDRVLVAWRSMSGALQVVSYSILDVMGNPVVAPQELAGSAVADVRVVVGSDGASFFIATNTSLYRLDAGGDVLSQTPLSATNKMVAAIAASAQARWLVFANPVGYSVIPFDATGTLGTAFDVTYGDSVTAWIARGSELFALGVDENLPEDASLSVPVPTMTLLRFDASGAITEGTRVAGTSGALALLESELVLAWHDRTRRNLAAIAP